MKPWEIFGLALGVVAFCLALPLLLGWSRERLWFGGGALLLLGAFALILVPLPHPAGPVDCGTVLAPRHAWTGQSLCAAESNCSNPDFHRQCAENRTARWQTIAIVTTGSLAIMTVSGVRVIPSRPPATR